jgi:hypothetical protein
MTRWLRAVVGVRGRTRTLRLSFTAGPAVRYHPTAVDSLGLPRSLPRHADSGSATGAGHWSSAQRTGGGWPSALAPRPGFHWQTKRGGARAVDGDVHVATRGSSGVRSAGPAFASARVRARRRMTEQARCSQCASNLGALLDRRVWGVGTSERRVERVVSRARRRRCMCVRPVEKRLVSQEREHGQHSAVILGGRC